MEKLQAAIEKARAQRQTSAPRKDKAEASPAKSELWKNLTPIEISQRITKKNRLVAFHGGAGAGPFDMLRTRIVQQAERNNWKRIALVSPHSGCGKSTTAANLAFSFGRQTDLSTMILDFDMRRVGLAKILGVESKHTMADVLQRRMDFSEHGRRYGDNVAIGLNGHTVQSASEILQNHQTQDVLDEIEAEYAPDIMLFDMPPLLGTDENFGFLKNVDCALLLAMAERTTVDQVDVAERQLAELTNVMGVVLGGCHYTDSVYGYSYGIA